MTKPGWLEQVAHAAARGAIAAMAMTGMRTVTQSLGLMPSTPPESVVDRGMGGALDGDDDGRAREVVIQATHWGYGALGGAAFGALPERLRRAAWAGPAYGLCLWFGFEIAVAPMLKLGRPAGTPERLALIADHLLYGLVLSEIRRRPQQ